MTKLRTDTIINRDALYALRELPEESVHCCVTSPPYYALRDYGLDMQIGREDTPEQYIDRLTEVFRELRRVLRSDGTLWLNIADTYCGTGNKGYHADPKNPKGRNGQQIARNNRVSGCKQKDLIGIPWLLAFALRADGWYLRSDIIWQKENPMPESVKDRPTRCYEHIFLLTKSKKYFYDAAAMLIVESFDLSIVLNYGTVHIIKDAFIIGISPPSTSWAYSRGLLYSSQSSSARCAGVFPYSSSMAMQSMARVVPSANRASTRLVSML